MTARLLPVSGLFSGNRPETPAGNGKIACVVKACVAVAVASASPSSAKQLSFLRPTVTKQVLRWNDIGEQVKMPSGYFLNIGLGLAAKAGAELSSCQIKADLVDQLRKQPLSATAACNYY